MEKLHIPTKSKKRAAAILGGFLILSGAGCSASEDGIERCRLGEGRIEIDDRTSFEEDVSSGEFKNPSNIIIYLTANEEKVSENLRDEMDERQFWSLQHGRNLIEAEDISCENLDGILGLNQTGEKLQAEAQRISRN